MADLSADAAKIVIGIMLSADSECATCGARLLHKFVVRFPQHKDEAEKAFKEYHDGSDLSSYK